VGHPVPSQAQTAAEVGASPTWTTSDSGCKVWNPRPQENESVKWSGTCSFDGLAQGYGVEQWYESGNAGNRLEGTLEDGKWTGRVFVTYPDGSTYNGKLSNGLPRGEGTFLYRDGSRYTGYFIAGHRNGWGEMTFPDGTKLTGEWSDGFPRGAGADTYPGPSQSSEQSGSVGPPLEADQTKSTGTPTKQIPSHHCGLTSLFAFVAAMGTAPTRSAGVAAADGLSAGLAACD
jgi:hypothetical protein